jgi:anti-sigma regulatory factor (Ser/Thr protein kinase)
MTVSDRQARRLARFTVPSVPGSERQALDQVARSVAGLGLPPERLDRLKTAVAEAVTNAAEHGNHGRAELPVEIEVSQHGRELVITVSDQGGQDGPGNPEDQAEVPDLARKLAGQQGPRGWGLFLIRHLVDAVDVTSSAGRHTVRLTMSAGAPAARH